MLNALFGSTCTWYFPYSIMYRLKALYWVKCVYIFTQLMLEHGWRYADPLWRAAIVIDSFAHELTGPPFVFILFWKPFSRDCFTSNCNRNYSSDIGLEKKEYELHAFYLFMGRCVISSNVKNASFTAYRMQCAINYVAAVAILPLFLHLTRSLQSNLAILSACLEIFVMRFCKLGAQPVL